MATERTYTRPVPGIGDFIFRRRVLRDQIRIEAEAIRMLNGPTTDPNLHNIALAVGTLSVLTVNAPEGWDLEALDPLIPSSVSQLWQVYGVLRAAEDEFLKGA